MLDKIVRYLFPAKQTVEDKVVVPEITVQFAMRETEGLRPVKTTEGSVAYDLRTQKDVVIGRRDLTDIDLGIVVIPPPGWHCELVLRSSVPKKYHGVSIPIGFGLIDPDYCGQDDTLILRLANNSWNSYDVPKGTRLCQLIVRPSPRLHLEELPYEEIKKPSRGGLGSSG